MARRKSVLVEDEKHCLVCRRSNVERHHVIYGTANRRLSEKYGYVVPLCHEHHRGQQGAHFSKDFDLYLKRKAQMHFEEHHGSRRDFIKTFGISFL